MEKYWDIFIRSFPDYWNYLKNNTLSLSWDNMVLWLIAISMFFWLLELVAPWRKDQPKIRKDFWLDGFYMFFNFFLFSLVGFAAISNVFNEGFNDLLGIFGITNWVAIEIQDLPLWVRLVLLFVLSDLISWGTHIILHRVPWLWEFHKVHHSVEQMGFAAHLRYHWMENVVYKAMRYIPLGMIGFGIENYLLISILTTSIGHFNHANITVPLGPFKYIFNNPQMHIWHHARELPPDRRYGVNYGISLSIWDYIFGTNYIPKNGRDIPLGYPDVEDMPQGFFGQMVAPFQKVFKPHKQ